MISADDRRAYLRRMREDFKKRGLCMTCGGRPARPERATCEVCSEKNSMYEKRRAKALKASRPSRPEPRCSSCGITGHNASGCRKAERVAGPGRECLRCKTPAALGEPYCPDHLAVLAELEAEGWEPPADDEEAAA